MFALWMTETTSTRRGITSVGGFLVISILFPSHNAVTSVCVSIIICTIDFIKRQKKRPQPKLISVWWTARYERSNHKSIGWLRLSLAAQWRWRRRRHSFFPPSILAGSHTSPDSTTIITFIFILFRLVFFFSWLSHHCCKYLRFILYFFSTYLISSVGTGEAINKFDVAKGTRGRVYNEMK